MNLEEAVMTEFRIPFKPFLEGTEVNRDENQ
jgi:hypothetical protein